MGHTAADCAAAATAADGRDQRSDYRDADGYPETQTQTRTHNGQRHRARSALERHRDSQTGWRDLLLVRSFDRVAAFSILCLKRKYFNLFIGHASLRYHFLPACLADVSTCVVS